SNRQENKQRQAATGTSNSRNKQREQATARIPGLSRKGLLLTAEGREDGVEVFEVSVFDDDLALALFVFYADFEAEVAADAVLGLADVWVFGLSFLLILFVLFGFWVYQTLHITL